MLKTTNYGKRPSKQALANGMFVEGYDNVYIAQQLTLLHSPTTAKHVAKMKVVYRKKLQLQLQTNPTAQKVITRVFKEKDVEQSFLKVIALNNEKLCNTELNEDNLVKVHQMHLGIVGVKTC